MPFYIFIWFENYQKTHANCLKKNKNNFVHFENALSLRYLFILFISNISEI